VEAARELLPQLHEVLAAQPNFIGLAAVVWRWIGDAALVTPTVRFVLERAAVELKRQRPQYTGVPAAALAAEIGDASLVPLLRGLLADPTSRSRVPAAQAVWRLTGDVDELIAPLLKEVTGRPPGGRWAEAFALLAEMGPAASAAVPELREVAEHPWCPFVDRFESPVHRGLGPPTTASSQRPGRRSCP
jgi:hypothetical protein